MMIEKWKRYCEGSSLLAWLTLGETGVWLIVTVISLFGKLLHFQVPIAEWTTLPSSFPIFITRPWTLISYMAVHFDVLHVLFNVLWLYWFGKILLISLPDRSLGMAFFGGGICGGLFFLISAALGFGVGWLCGCSAAVISVMCVAAIRTPDYPVNLFLIGEVKLKWIAVVCCLLTFLGGGGNQVAHIGGLTWGVAMGLMIQKGIDPTKWMPDFTRNSSKTREPKRSADKVARVLRQRQEDIARLDQLLDKIKLSGYDSLSRKEQKELNELSKRIKTH